MTVTTHNRKFITMRWMLCASAAMAATPALAQAQPASPGPDNVNASSISDASTIVVTAQRRNERLQDVPISVTAFSAGSLAQKQVNNLLNIARFTPNVEINTGIPDGGGSSLNAYIRGVGQQDFIPPTDPGVGVYLDDVYLARTVGSTIDLSDVERVEVLRGPQGTLYGKNSVGGAIKIVTRRPEVSGPWKGQLEGTFGRFNRTDFKAYATGPLIENMLGIKLAVAGIHRDGYGHRVTQDIDLGDQNKLVGRAALRWTPNDGLDITLQGDYQHQRQHGMVQTMINRFPADVDLTGLAGLLTTLPGSPFAGVTDPTPQNPFLFDDFYNAFIVPTVNARLGLPANNTYGKQYITHDPYLSYGTGRSRDDNDIWGVSLNISQDLSDDVTLKSITAYRKIKAFFPQDADNTPYIIGSTSSTFRQHQFSEEVQLGGKAMDDKLDFLVGAYYLREYAHDTNDVALFSGLYDALNPVAPFLYTVGPCIGTGATADCTTNAFDIDFHLHNIIHTSSLAGFAQATYRFSDQLSFTAGGRYSTEKKRYLQDFGLTNVPDPKFGPGLPGYTGSVQPVEQDGLARFVGPRVLQKRWNNFTPKLGIDYKITPQNLLYGSWSKGFKTGGWSPRPSSGNNTDLSYGPEELSTFEVGSKNVFLGGKLVVNLSAFYSFYNDVQVTTNRSGGQNNALILLRRNVGDARLYGMEAEVNARPFRNFELNVSGGWLHSEWHKFNRSVCDVATFDATGGQYCDMELSLDDRLIDSPKFTANIGGQYTVPLQAQGKLIFGADASYRSKTWKDPFNLGRGTNALGQVNVRKTIAPNDPNYEITLPELAQKGYWLVNIRAAWTDADDHFEIAAGVTNLFDKSYMTTILPSNTLGYDPALFGRPREWFTSVRYKF